MTVCEKGFHVGRQLIAGTFCLSVSFWGGGVHADAPAGYQQRLSMPVSIDGKAAVLQRYEKLSGRHNGLFGEHVSTVIRQDGQLQGFVNMDIKYAKAQSVSLPSAERAQAIANNYLAEVAPDLLKNRRILWVDVHDETIRVRHNNGLVDEVIVQGMKVKSRNTATGLYFWVIVGADEQVMVFERDIRWIMFPGKRATEKWLHDAWLAKQLEGELPPLKTEDI